MRSEQEAERAIRLYSDTIRRICFVHLKNHADVEDIFQDVFLKYILSDTVFKNNEHEKAWFIRVTVNACRDLIKSAFRSRSVSLDEAINATSNANEDDRHVLEAVLKLPKKYRDIVYLHYYEGYTAPEIGKILNKNENTVYTILKRARELLKKSLGGDENG
ncbi:MAG: sigma-70 family RNA polymerase sigma factor [Ruminococcaceae bacterium]|nr:sigma-70 family RNA polymerase sigma factor [Oscillospiraceae bacterium]